MSTTTIPDEVLSDILIPLDRAAGVAMLLASMLGGEYDRSQPLDLAKIVFYGSSYVDQILVKVRAAANGRWSCHEFEQRLGIAESLVSLVKRVATISPAAGSGNHGHAFHLFEEPTCNALYAMEEAVDGLDKFVAGLDSVVGGGATSHPIEPNPERSSSERESFALTGIIRDHDGLVNDGHEPERIAAAILEATKLRAAAAGENRKAGTEVIAGARLAQYMLRDMKVADDSDGEREYTGKAFVLVALLQALQRDGSVDLAHGFALAMAYYLIPSLDGESIRAVDPCDMIAELARVTPPKNAKPRSKSAVPA